MVLSNNHPGGLFKSDLLPKVDPFAFPSFYRRLRVPLDSPGRALCPSRLIAGLPRGALEDANRHRGISMVKSERCLRK